MNRILITGVPGVGKSEISKEISLILGYKLINDKNYSVKNKLGYYDLVLGQKEYFVDISKLNKSVLEFFKQSKKDLLFEGHLWCELSKTNLKRFDVIIILVLDKKILESRLKKRNYPELKIQDNLFSQEFNYIENLFIKKNVCYKKIKITSNLKKNVNKIKSVLKNGKSISNSTSSKCKRNK